MIENFEEFLENKKHFGMFTQGGCSYVIIINNIYVVLEVIVMKGRSLHYSKTGDAQVIAAEIGRIHQCVSDKIPSAYPCDGEKLVFIGAEMGKKPEKAIEDFCRALTPSRTKNVAFYVINGTGDVSGLDEIKKALTDNGVNVVAVKGIEVKSGLFKKGKITQEDIDATLAWAGEIVNGPLA